MEVLKMKVAQLCPTVWDPMDYRVHGILLARALECIAFPFSRGSSWPRSLNPGRPGIEPTSPTFQADSLPAKPPGKPNNTGVGCLSLLQGRFPTQEWNQGFLHCRCVLYQVSYQRSPKSEDPIWKCALRHSVRYSEFSIFQSETVLRLL